METILNTPHLRTTRDCSIMSEQKTKGETMTREQAIKGIGWRLREVLETWEDLRKLAKHIPELKDSIGVHNIFGGQEMAKDELSQILTEEEFEWLMNAYKKYSSLV